MDFKMETVNGCSRLESPVGNSRKIAQIKIGKSLPYLSNVAKMKARELLSSWCTIAKRAQQISSGTSRERIYPRRPFWRTRGICQYRNMCDATHQNLRHHAGHRRRVPARNLRTYYSHPAVPSRPRNHSRLHLRTCCCPSDRTLIPLWRNLTIMEATKSTRTSMMKER